MMVATKVYANGIGMEGREESGDLFMCRIDDKNLSMGAAAGTNDAPKKKAKPIQEQVWLEVKTTES